MIGYLDGTIGGRSHDHALVVVQGVGYCVYLTPTTLQHLPIDGTAIQLHIHTHVREDQISLFGFLERHELQLFQRLLGVQGIGPKLALGILAGLTPNDFVSAVVGDDLVRLNAIPGIGKKTAERIIIDLKDRFLKEGFTLHAVPSVNQDAISALVNLGYTRVSVERAVTKIAREGEQSLDKLIKSALKELAQP